MTFPYSTYLLHVSPELACHTCGALTAWCEVEDAHEREDNAEQYRVWPGCPVHIFTPAFNETEQALCVRRFVQHAAGSYIEQITVEPCSSDYKVSDPDRFTVLAWRVSYVHKREALQRVVLWSDDRQIDYSLVFADHLAIEQASL